jgi:hypothetical protein
MTASPPTQEEETKLSFVSLNQDDDITMLLNDDPKYAIQLPANISKKNVSDKKRIIENKILDACSKYAFDYVSQDNITKCTKEVVDQLYERARVTKNYVAQPSHTTIIEKYENNYFEFLVECVRKTVKEENSLIRQIVYTMLSAYGNDPINLGVLAPTSTGKTYPITEVVRFTPGGKEVRIVGSMTPKVLVREHGILVDKEGKPIGKEVRRLKNEISEVRANSKLKKGGTSGNKKKALEQLEELEDELGALLDGSAYIVDMSNMTLIFLEPPHPELWSMIKPILSHDSWEIEHPFVEKVASGGLEVKRIITRGWPACIFCSAKDESKWDMWPEVESRFMISSPNIVRLKFQAGNKLIAQRKGLPRGVKQQLIISDTEKELGKQCFLYLKHQIKQSTSTTDSPVWIPFGERLAEILPADKGQDNRAVNRFFTTLNMIALSKGHLRHKLLWDDEELVIATLDDLRETLHVVQNMTGLPPHKLKFYRQYILPLYKSLGEKKLETREICDFYNANNPKGTMQMNSDNLRKNYLQELVNHNYLEQERDEDTKAIKYLYTPLVAEEEEEEEGEQEQPPTAPTLGPIFQNLHFSKLLIPENYQGMPSDWLNQEILQLSDRRLTKAPLKILNNKGNDVPIEEFIKHYESENGLKLSSFLKVPKLVATSKSIEITKPKGFDWGGNGKNTEKEGQNEEKWKTQPKVGEVGRTDFDEIIQKAAGDKGYFTINDFVYTLIMLPNEGWTENEAEQTLQSLINEGKITQIEEGRFKPKAV